MSRWFACSGDACEVRSCNNSGASGGGSSKRGHSMSISRRGGRRGSMSNSGSVAVVYLHTISYVAALRANDFENRRCWWPFDVARKPQLVMRQRPR